ncbi:hypothetical protein HELRODRAFT_161956 [Helobdella robusta]|uniref:Integrator complex subunit 9 n=1 Tax=Helobdella robusta TaxID=6412 RepID=T1ES31_HELRO|nr:hypothetical protein HELRODRAFT_161956 [Helobdella robusta]ESO02665.1 hypothetical protein HELRODRAFT_161956 [Helobdella robusta]
MRIHNLSTNPNFPCSLLNVNNVTVMLDCALDVSTLSLFAPLDVIPSQQCQSDSFSIKNVQKDFLDVFSVKYINTTPEFIIPNIELLDVSMIDVVLISNFNYILGLPYVTEHPDFRGVVYATEPTTQFGKLLMEEYTKPLEKVNRPRSLKSLFSKSSQISELASLRRTALATNNNNNGSSSNNTATTITNNISNNNKEFPSLRRWRKMYSSSDVLSCLRKMEVIAYNEAKEIPGGLILQAFSSGFCIGSCNWTISSPYHKAGNSKI